MGEVGFGLERFIHPKVLSERYIVIVGHRSYQSLYRPEFFEMMVSAIDEEYRELVFERKVFKVALSVVDRVVDFCPALDLSQSLLGECAFLLFGVASR